ncbi:hypothetical protein CWI38_2184p0010 [Hamiltosporidium tvaerminnensis]|uniref:Uncharacterized protein n=1 Tax=Hamiltosporidium tvaerminnensis TaxID=1176355 RepID=A0A4Q9LLA3_9MICR|nr:hypothetical protein CWI38_2184p0010 [Hamiltosporidium tvaerminnensis]
MSNLYKITKKSIKESFNIKAKADNILEAPRYMYVAEELGSYEYSLSSVQIKNQDNMDFTKCAIILTSLV